MSHVSSVRIEIRSLEALRLACRRLGLQLNEGQKTHKWYGRWVGDYHGADAAFHHGIKPEDYGKCEHAISIPGDDEAYEIGLVANPEGEGWIPVFDFWGPGKRMKEKVGGQDCRRLRQEYAAAVAEMEAQDLIAQGWQLSRVERPNGDIELVLSDEMI